MKMFTLLAVAAAVLALANTNALQTFAETQESSPPAISSGAGGSSKQTITAGGAHVAQDALESIKKLSGKWQASLPDGRPIVDVFRPFAYGTAVLGEEWVGGEQVTSTVFYVVGSELRADHYCDLKNQPHYVAKTSADLSVIEFEFRGATNLDTHPTHFHSTKWRLVDASHLIQDWRIEGDPKGPSELHLDFRRTE